MREKDGDIPGVCYGFGAYSRVLERAYSTGEETPSLEWNKLSATPLLGENEVQVTLWHDKGHVIFTKLAKCADRNSLFKVASTY